MAPRIRSAMKHSQTYVDSDEDEPQTIDSQRRVQFTTDVSVGNARQDPFIRAKHLKNRSTRESITKYDSSLTNDTELICPHSQVSDTYPGVVPDVQHIVNFMVPQKESWSLVGRFAAGQPFDLQIQQPAAPSLKQEQSIIEIIVDVQGAFPPGTGLDGISHRCRCGKEGTHTTPGPPMRFKQMKIRQVRKRSMRIRSVRLQEGLRNVFHHYYPGLSWAEDGLVLPEPYSPLLRYYPEILAIAHKAPCTKSYLGLDPEELVVLSKAVGKTDANGMTMIESETARQFTLLANLLRSDYEAFAQTHWDKLNFTSPSVSFDGLWLLYRPGADAYFEISGVRFGAVVQSIFYDEDEDDNGYAKVKFWMLVSNGKTIVRREQTITILEYQGDKSPTELDLKVFKYIDSAHRERLKTQMQDRGLLVYRLLRQTSREMQYDGITTRHRTSLGDYDPDEEAPYVQLSMTADASKDLKTESISGRVIIDHEEGSSEDLRLPGSKSSNLDELPWYGTGTARPPAPYKAYREIDIKHTPFLTNHHYLLLYPELVGFIPKSKQWKWLSADFLSEVQRVENPTKNLVLADEHLNMIRAMSEQHLTDCLGWGADFIPSKGIGQTVLLHGPPGVGKTYTVECIAEEFKRPLLPLSPSDLSTEEADLEKRLTQWFSLAERWNAILLIDEADLFLERRKQADIERNGLVTVFLRQLEYFQGLLFVTTNRVGHIDDAFISRVQIVIRYPKLSDDDRQRIWEAFFDKLEEEKDGLIAVTQAAKDFVLNSKEVAECEWNGRNIRNAVQTAIRLAAYDKKTTLSETSRKKQAVLVKDKHFRQVARMSHDFQVYLNSIQETDEEGRAVRRKDRPPEPGAGSMSVAIRSPSRTPRSDI